MSPSEPAGTEFAITELASTETARMSQEENLALYHYSSCPFCVRVRQAMADLDLDLELRDITASEVHMRELVEATGRQTVPCLRIEGPSGEVQWMHESSKIIHYLQENVA